MIERSKRSALLTVAIGLTATLSLPAVARAEDQPPTGGATNPPAAVPPTDGSTAPAPPAPAPTPPPTTPPPAGGGGDSPVGRAAQWIWQAAKAGGTATAIAARAKQYAIDTVFLKCADGGTFWRQCDLIRPLQQAGLKVCAWSFVYGRKPIREANLAARAIGKGPDCYVIDAETSYEGRYRSARTFMKTLRLKVGPAFPIGLSSFPYVFYHKSFPYSVFLERPYGANVNMPQIYWRAIGASVTKAMQNTYPWNNIYGAQIAPTAGLWKGETSSEIGTFQQLALANGSKGVSYWSMQHTRSWQWPLLAFSLDGQATVAPFAARYPTLGVGFKGDPVVQLQILLNKWGYSVPRTGLFKQTTAEALRGFQLDNNLAVTGKTDAGTWDMLLKDNPSPTPDSGGGAAPASKASGKAQAARMPAKRGIKESFDRGLRVPESAKLPSTRNEIPSPSRR